MTSLNKELSVCREAEGALRAQLQELASLQALPEEVNNLMKQVSAPNIQQTSAHSKLQYRMLLKHQVTAIHWKEREHYRYSSCLYLRWPN